MRSTKPRCFKSYFGCLDKKGCMGFVPWCWDLQCKSSWILNIFSLKIRLNCSWNFRRNWNVPLVLLERTWWERFNEIYLVRFGFRMWQILIFKWFLQLKIKRNSKKNQVLEWKIIWGRSNTWANGTGHTSWDLWLNSKDMICVGLSLVPGPDLWAS
jgi:hypothetical protein